MATLTELERAALDPLVRCSRLNFVGVEGNFPVLSVSFRTSLSGLGTGSPTISAGDVTLTKEFNACSVPLFSANAQAAKRQSIQISSYVVVTKEQLSQPTMERKMMIQLEAAYISSYQITTLDRPDSGPVLV